MNDDDDDNKPGNGRGPHITPRRSPPVPTTREGLLARRTLQQQPNLNDAVEVHFVKLWAESEEFRNLLGACYIQETVEGNFGCDDQEAARMIRKAAEDSDDHFVARDAHGGKRTLAVLIKTVHVVANRYNLNRRKRAAGEAD